MNLKAARELNNRATDVHFPLLYNTAVSSFNHPSQKLRMHSIHYGKDFSPIFPQSLITFPVPCLLTQQLAHGQLHQHLFIILLNNFWNTRYEVAQISDNAWPWSKLNMQSHQFFWRSFVLTFGPGSGQNCTLGIHSISKCFYFFIFGTRVLELISNQV